MLKRVYGPPKALFIRDHSLVTKVTTRFLRAVKVICGSDRYTERGEGQIYIYDRSEEIAEESDDHRQVVEGGGGQVNAGSFVPQTRQDVGNKIPELDWLVTVGGVPEY